MRRKPTVAPAPHAATIAAFQKRVHKIDNTRILRTGGLAVSTTLTYKAGVGLTVDAFEPDPGPDDWHYLLALTRALTAKGEVAGIKAFLAIIQKTVDDSGLRDAVAECGKTLKQVLARGVMGFSPAGQQYKPSDIPGHAHNADYLHDDLDRIAQDGPVLEAEMTAPIVSTIRIDATISIVKIARAWMRS